MKVKSVEPDELASNKNAVIITRYKTMHHTNVRTSDHSIPGQ